MSDKDMLRALLNDTAQHSLHLKLAARERDFEALANPPPNGFFAGLCALCFPPEPMPTFMNRVQTKRNEETRFWDAVCEELQFDDDLERYSDRINLAIDFGSARTFEAQQMPTEQARRIIEIIKARKGWTEFEIQDQAKLHAAQMRFIRLYSN